MLIDNKYNSALRIALKEVRKARNRQHLHSAVILNGSNIVSVGHNFSAIHAEQHAVGRGWKSDLAGTTLIVIRTRKNGSIGMSRPCNNCLTYMVNAGIKKVIYSDASGKMQLIKLPTSKEVNILNSTLQSILWNQGTK